MKKVLLALFFAFFLCGSVSALAEELVIEGENYSEITYTPIIPEGKPEFSNSSFLQYFSKYQPEKKYIVTYKVNAENEGGYRLKTTTTYLNKAWTSDYYVDVNGVRIDAAEVCKSLGIVNSSDYYDLFGIYDLGLVQLKKGENEIAFEIKAEDIREDGMTVTWIDCFSLEYIPFGIYDTNPHRELGVFETDDNVKIDINLTTVCPEDMVIPFDVKNFWQQTVLEGNLSVKKGATFVTLDLGKMDFGWYQLDTALGAGSNKTYFAVMRNESEYYAGETPFAVDFASQILQNGERDIPKYANAAKLAGIHWVRERFSNGSYNSAKNVYNPETAEKVRMLSDAGLKVSVAFTESPAWAVERGYYFADLTDAYNLYYNAAKDYAGDIDMWECWNEEDTAFASEPADEYSAFMKTMAIAIADSNPETLKCNGGFANHPAQTPFHDLCMQNGLIDYMDVYNYHGYGSKTALDNLPEYNNKAVEENMNLVYGYGHESGIPTWITEGGMARDVNHAEGQIAEMKWQRKKEAAQASVINVVQSLSRGTGKHFWFILGPYVETENEFGMFNIENQPHPIYASYANLIYQLRKGKYMGKVSGLELGAEGHIFNNGDHDVAVIWADHTATFSPKTMGKYKIVDIMGNERSASYGDSITISKYPVYIHFEGDASLDDYMPREHNIKELTPKTFTAAQKVVMCQRFYGENYNTPRTDGYSITGGNRDNAFNLEVYNYNDTPVTATIKGTPEVSGYYFEESEKTITVPAKSRGVLEFNLKANESVKYDVTSFLRFDGVIGDEKMSPSVSRIIAVSPYRVEPDELFDASQDASKWNTTNCDEATKIYATNTSDGKGVDFRFELSGNAWAYPKFDVADAGVLADTTGLCFDVESDKTAIAFGMNVFIDFVDGRRYFLGNNNFMDVREGKFQIKVPWTKFVMFSSPLGALVDIRTFDPTLIQQIEIGGNRKAGTGPNPRYTISNVGYYTADFELSTSKTASIEIFGIKDGDVFKQGELPHVSAVWNENLEYEEIGVMFGDKDYDKFTVEGNSMSIDVSELKRGYYRMMVYAKTKMGYMHRSYLSFGVE